MNKSTDKLIYTYKIYRSTLRPRGKLMKNEKDKKVIMEVENEKGVKDKRT